MSQVVDFPEDLRARFTPTRVLGAGGMGVVFLASDRDLGREVAVKLVLAPRDPQQAHRLRREAEALSRITHPHVVRVFDAGECSRGPFLVQEFVTGGSLSPDHPFPVLVRAMGQIAEGLEAVHRCDLLHRDVKPANILVEAGTGRAVLTDFGLVKDHDRTSLTRTGMHVGTPAYLAPEVWRGQGFRDQSDWYGWGVTLFHLLEDRLPFTGEEIFAWATRGVEPQLRFDRIRPDSALADLLRRQLSGDPDRRENRPRVVRQALESAEVARIPPPADRVATPGPRGAAVDRNAATVVLAVPSSSRRENQGAERGNRGEASPAPSIPPAGARGDPGRRLRIAAAILVGALGLLPWVQTGTHRDPSNQESPVTEPRTVTGRSEPAVRAVRAEVAGEALEAGVKKLVDALRSEWTLAIRSEDVPGARWGSDQISSVGSLSRMTGTRFALEGLAEILALERGLPPPETWSPVERIIRGSVLEGLVVPLGATDIESGRSPGYGFETGDLSEYLPRELGDWLARAGQGGAGSRVLRAALAAMNRARVLGLPRRPSGLSDPALRDLFGQSRSRWLEVFGPPDPGRRRPGSIATGQDLFAGVGGMRGFPGPPAGLERALAREAGGVVAKMVFEVRRCVALDESPDEAALVVHFLLRGPLQGIPQHPLLTVDPTLLLGRNVGSPALGLVSALLQDADPPVDSPRKASDPGAVMALLQEVARAPGSAPIRDLLRRRAGAHRLEIVIAEKSLADLRAGIADAAELAPIASAAYLVRAYGARDPIPPGRKADLELAKQTDREILGHVLETLRPVHPSAPSGTALQRADQLLRRLRPFEPEVVLATSGLPPVRPLPELEKMLKDRLGETWGPGRNPDRWEAIELLEGAGLRQLLRAVGSQMMPLLRMASGTNRDRLAAYPGFRTLESAFRPMEERSLPTPLGELSRLAVPAGAHSDPGGYRSPLREGGWVFLGLSGENAFKGSDSGRFEALLDDLTEARARVFETIRRGWAPAWSQDLLSNPASVPGIAPRGEPIGTAAPGSPLAAVPSRRETEEVFGPLIPRIPYLPLLAVAVAESDLGRNGTSHVLAASALLGGPLRGAAYFSPASAFPDLVIPAAAQSLGATLLRGQLAVIGLEAWLHFRGAREIPLERARQAERDLHQVAVAATDPALIQEALGDLLWLRARGLSTLGPEGAALDLESLEPWRERPRRVLELYRER